MKIKIRPSLFMKKVLFLFQSQQNNYFRLADQKSLLKAVQCIAIELYSERSISAGTLYV